MRTREQRIRDWYGLLRSIGYDHERAIEELAEIAFREAAAA